MSETRPEAPTEFQDGFTWRTVVGAIFIALFMIPGGMYLGLVAGMGVGDAAEWVTIVLFAELARRSYQPLRKQEVYVLYYVAAALTSALAIEKGLSGGPFGGLIWTAYFSQSEQASPIAAGIPGWAVPVAGSPGLVGRELWHPDWWVPIGFLVLIEFCSRLGWMGLGYALFRITSDVEKLPFPYASVAASGATALAEAGTETWRWRIFSAGTVIGLLFGALYIGLPVITGILTGTAVQIFPIPFADYTVAVENLLPGAIVGISLSLGNIIFGMVLPFEIVLGAAVSSVLASIVLNPILVKSGLMPNYVLGSNGFLTKLTADMDFWLSVGIGINLAVATLGIMLVIKAFREHRKKRAESKYTLVTPAGRGDIPIQIALCVWLVATLTLVYVCHRLVPGFPLWILAFFGLLWTPINSYISARMIGLTGRGVGFPLLREASVVGSGYPGTDVWFAPLPIQDHGWAAQRFREVELTGTKFGSIVKAEILMFPLMLIASFAFWAFFWKTNPLPSSQFPYANRFWPIQAQMQAALMQMNRTEGANWFKDAIKPVLIGWGYAGGLGIYALCALFKLPSLFFYGFAGGIGAFPAITLPQLLGAWIGKRFFSRKYGAETWGQYAPVLFAGFACGSGLVSMIAISLALIAKAVSKLPY